MAVKISRSHWIGSFGWWSETAKVSILGEWSCVVWAPSGFENLNDFFVCSAWEFVVPTTTMTLRLDSWSVCCWSPHLSVSWITQTPKSGKDLVPFLSRSVFGVTISFSLKAIFPLLCTSLPQVCLCLLGVNQVGGECQVQRRFSKLEAQLWKFTAKPTFLLWRNTTNFNLIQTRFLGVKNDFFEAKKSKIIILGSFLESATMPLKKLKSA